MRTITLKQMSVLCLLLLCLGCEPKVVTPDNSGQATKSSRTSTASRLETRNNPTPQIAQGTEIFPAQKTPQPLIFEFSLSSGDVLSLKGGLTDEAHNIIQSGKTGYFLLCFTNPMDPSVVQSVKDTKIKILKNRIWLYAEVPPSELETLEKWSRDGLLAFGGPLPPVGKINKRLGDAIHTQPNGTSEVVVFFFYKIPDEAVKKQVSNLFDEVDWPQMVETLPVMSGKIKNSNISQLTDIPLVLEIDLAGGPVNH
jgi:hypothetical protein